MSVKVVVRSFKRPDTIMKETLGYLLNQTEQLPIYLVLANQDEKESYKALIDAGHFADVIISGIGCDKAVNAAIDYFPEGEPLIFIDDDMRGIAMYKSIKLGEEELDEPNMKKYYEYAFRKMAEYNVSGLTIDYVNNLLFKQSKPFFEFKPRAMGGAWWGMFNDKNSKVFQGHLEDNIRTAYFLEKDGMVASLNWMVARTSYGTNAGGMQESGERGDDSTRVEHTKQLCEYALTFDWFKKYFPSYYYMKDANVYHAKMVTHHEMKRVLNYRNIKYSGYFQELPNGSEKVDLADLF